MIINSIEPPQGSWVVGETKHTNKIQALLDATKRKLPVQYQYHHNVWNNFDRSLLGKIGLKELYKQRAQMLRDKYDYLILYYSGGSDSWTVLNTFLENNIKLDCIYVRWPKKAENTYTPNTVNRTAFNFMSEWDFVLKKDLEWLAQAHPGIRIEVVDWTDNINPKYFNDDIFSTQNHMYSAANLLRMQKFSQLEIDLLDSGKRVGEIWGIDKPIIIEFADGKVGMQFKDEIISVGQAYHGNPDGPEFFYWSPEFPLLCMEQAYQCFLFYKANPPLRSIVANTNWKKMFSNRMFVDHRAMYADYTQHLTRKIVYPDWDFSKFQAEKPKSITREDKDFWLYNSEELKPIIDRWRYYYRSQLDQIGDDFMWKTAEGVRLGVRSYTTIPYYIGNYNDV
jgi:hypothetical protein